MPTLLGVVVVGALLLLLLAISVGAATPILVASVNRTLAPGQVDYSTYGVRPCKCRQECATNSSCEGVTVINSSCAFTAQKLLPSALQDSDVGARTYLKPKPCEAPFEVVPGVGCVSVSNTAVNGTEVMTACPEGSSQWCPATDVIFWKLVRYIRVVKGDGRLLHAGVEYRNGIWTWPDGHTLSSEPGSAIWAGRDPNCDPGVVCAYIVHDLLGLIDTECTRTANYICSIP